MVVATSTWRMEMSRQYPAWRSARVNGSGGRARQRSASTRIWPGPSRSQISCKAAGSSHEANPSDSSLKDSTAPAAWRLAHSCPLTQILPG